MQTHEPHQTSDSAQRLLVLPLGKSIQIAFQSLRVRFLRSLITVASLVLAIAFFCFTQVGTDLADSMLQTGNDGFRQALVRAGYDLSPVTTSIGSTPKQKWLMFLSLLVCLVGIVNAQLMSVSERVREIGTMKCLGALDRFILRIFLLEAGMQGLVGSAAGALVGTAAALIIGMVRFGPQALKPLAFSQVAFSLLLSMAVGLGLSLTAVIYPAAKAARMQPVEAMRREF